MTHPLTGHKLERDGGRNGGSYMGRFAPSPTGPLHAGSLVAALASWLDARAHGGRWLVRMEDVDTPRCLPGMDAVILHQLATLGLHPDEAPCYQSRQAGAYSAALARLKATGWAYPCTCSRQAVLAELTRLGRTRERGGELVYPGTCRSRLDAPDETAEVTFQRPPETAAWRLRTDRARPEDGHWLDRRLGPQVQAVETEVGDFVLRRADGCFTYQLAVVVDDAAQGVTDVVRGEDLADNTARQRVLQQALALPRLRYLHVPLVRGGNGEKLSKQNGAAALDLADPLATLNQAAQALGLQAARDQPVGEALSAWVAAWQYGPMKSQPQPYNPAGD